MEIGWKRKAEELVDHALAEDWAWGDVTTQALIPAEAEGKASFIAKSAGVVAGIEVAHLVFARVDASLKFHALLHDGDKLERGARIGAIEGKVAGILRGERVALNFLQRLSGIATETNRYVEAVRGTKATWSAPPTLGSAGGASVAVGSGVTATPIHRKVCQPDGKPVRSQRKALSPGSPSPRTTLTRQAKVSMTPAAGRMLCAPASAT